MQLLLDDRVNDTYFQRTQSEYKEMVLEEVSGLEVTLEGGLRKSREFQGKMRVCRNIFADEMEYSRNIIQMWKNRENVKEK